MVRISPRQLQIFTATARAGSISAAAGQLHLSQPAASMALAQLEKMLGYPLFDRAPRHLTLNACGREMLPAAEDILERLRAFASTEDDGEVGGDLRLGTSNTVGNYRVAELLGPFVAGCPGVAVAVEIDNTDRIIAALLPQRLDVACVEEAPHHDDLELHHWRNDALAVCVGPAHPLATRKRLQPADLGGLRWILREAGSATRRQSERILARLPAGETVLELGQTEAIKQAVGAGLGAAVLPRIAVQDAVAAQQLVILPTPFLELERPLTLLLHRRRYRSRALRAFLASMDDGLA